MTSRKYITRISLYLLLILLVDSVLVSLIYLGKIPVEFKNLEKVALCFLIGGIGGVIYCLRGVYVNACSLKTWDPEWLPWYLIRPIVSHFSGLISFLFVKAGLLLLEAEGTEDPTGIGFLALAFIAGLNVDKFLKKVEGMAKAAWGVEPSNMSKNKSSKKD